MNKPVLTNEVREKIRDRVFHFTEVLNGKMAGNLETVPKTIREIDKLINVLYSDIYGFVDNKKQSNIPDEKCGHCG